MQSLRVRLYRDCDKNLGLKTKFRSAFLYGDVGHREKKTGTPFSASLTERRILKSLSYLDSKNSGNEVIVEVIGRWNKWGMLFLNRFTSSTFSFPRRYLFKELGDNLATTFHSRFMSSGHEGTCKLRRDGANETHLTPSSPVLYRFTLSRR